MNQKVYLVIILTEISKLKSSPDHRQLRTL